MSNPVIEGIQRDLHATALGKAELLCDYHTTPTSVEIDSPVLFEAITGSVYGTATALTGLASATDFERQITLDEAYAATEISDGLVGWPPTLEPTVERWPWLRPWIDVIDWLFGQEGGGSLRGPGEWIDGPYELVSRFGTEPATTQAQLGTG